MYWLFNRWSVQLSANICVHIKKGTKKKGWFILLNHKWSHAFPLLSSLSPTSPRGYREQSNDAWPSETWWIVMNGGKARGLEEKEEEEGAQSGLLLQNWCRISRAGHSGDWQDVQWLLILGPFSPRTARQPPPSRAERCCSLNPPSGCRSALAAFLLIEEKIVSTDGGGGCIRGGNGCWGGGVRVGGGGVPGYSTCCLHPGFTKEINILLLTVLDCWENKEKGRQRPEDRELRLCDAETPRWTRFN